MKKIYLVLPLAALMIGGTSCSAMNSAAEKVKKINQRIFNIEESGNLTTIGFTETAGVLTAENIAGEWQIATVDSKNIIEEDNVPYIVFEVEKGRFYANNGCNTLNGSFSMEDGKITIGTVACTMRMCPDAPFQFEINRALADNTVLTTTPIYKIGADTFLTLTDGKGKAVMTLRKKNMEFLNGNWKIVMADGQKINDDEANVFFDIRELKLHGNTGCNFVNGDIYIDPQRPNAIDISNMAVTRRYCPKTDQERAITVALENAYTAQEGSEKDSVLLIDKSGKTIMKLVKAPIRPEE